VCSPLWVLNHALILFSGYPPADHGVRDYLTAVNSKNAAYDHASAFLEALFDHTAETLSAFDGQHDYIAFAKKFRTHMTVGQKVTGHNQFREDFYNQVIEKATLLENGRVRNIRVCRYT
jgi:hypothetical protein